MIDDRTREAGCLIMGRTLISGRSRLSVGTPFLHNDCTVFGWLAGGELSHAQGDHCDMCYVWISYNHS